MEIREKDLAPSPDNCVEPVQDKEYLPTDSANHKLEEPRKSAKMPYELTAESIVFSESDNGSRKYACVLMPDGTEISERIPLHVFKMAPQEMEFAFREIARNLRRKVMAYGKAFPQPVVGNEQVLSD